MTFSRWILKTSRDGNCMFFLSSLCFCSCPFVKNWIFHVSAYACSLSSSILLHREEPGWVFNNLCCTVILLKSFCINPVPSASLLVKCSDPWLLSWLFPALAPVCLVLGQPVLSTGSVWSDKNWGGAEISPGPDPVCATQELFPVCCQGMQGSCGAHQDAQGPFCRAAAQLATAHFVLLQGIFPSQLWEFVFVFLSFIRSLLKHSSACPGSSEGQFSTWMWPLVHPSLVQAMSFWSSTKNTYFIFLTLIVALIRPEWEHRTSMFPGAGFNKSWLSYKNMCLHE